MRQHLLSRRPQKIQLKPFPEVTEFNLQGRAELCPTVPTPLTAPEGDGAPAPPLFLTQMIPNALARLYF